MGKRENNFDLLRIVSALAVILLHVSAGYLTLFEEVGLAGFSSRQSVIGIFLVHGMTRFAVPCFVMMAGAFALCDERNRNCRYYYRKTLKNVWIPMLVFSVLYVGYEMLTRAIGRLTGTSPASDLVMPIVRLLQGEPFYHMWYLYAMIGVYLLAPFVIRFKEEFGPRTYEKMVWVFVAAASIGAWTSTAKLNWDIGSAFRYLGYFMLGDVLRRRCSRKSLPGSLGAILAGACFLLLAGWMRYRELAFGGGWGMDWAMPLSPAIVTGSGLIFAGFAMMPVKRPMGKLAGLTFLVYLIHAVVWDVLAAILPWLSVRAAHPLAWSLASTVLTTALTLPLCLLYRWLWNLLETRFRIFERICDRVIPTANV